VRHVAPHLPLHTFTAGFGPGDGHLAAAAAVARHFGTEHHEVVLEPDRLPELLPRVVWHMEDPIGREEMVFWYLIAREARKHAATLLCGNLSDLLFGGMPRFIVVKAAAALPLLKRLLEEFYNCTQNGTRPASLLGRLLARAYHGGTPMPPPVVRGAAGAPDPAVFDLDDPQPLNAHLIAGLQGQPNPNAAYERLYAAGGISYNSPFYDLDVVDHAFTVPDRLKIRGRQQKYIVRQAAEGLLPAEILRRPKGLLRLARDRRFSQVLAALAADRLPAARVRERGLFEPAEVERIRRLPADGVYPEDQLYRLWTLLLTEIWAGIFLDGRGTLPATAEEAALADAA
jgi:asparagine synthase (glutamine-hydrolysing)